ncbi:MAG: mechanosensitive ion channel [Candidatus Aenigmarchaeota archaeon]|nr:mechanosensitive ion channel [Candidatus Aenigmarchaeota archaeon]MBI5229510.1 mechanosensitive ion channel [Candidatus Micrarchaeota archaeon]
MIKMDGYGDIALLLVNLFISIIFATISSIAVSNTLKRVFKNFGEGANKIKSHIFYFLLFLGAFMSFYGILQQQYPVINIMITAIFAAYLITKLLDIFVAWYLSRLWVKTGIEIREDLIPLFVRILKAAIYLIVFIIAFQKMGYDVGALVAGLGIGGLALALASQQTLSNLFAAVSLLADKSMQVGDRIKVENAEGTVIEVGWRSTRIKTDDGIVIYPNSVLANSKITKLQKK